MTRERMCGNGWPEYRAGWHVQSNKWDKLPLGTRRVTLHEFRYCKEISL